MLRLQLRPLQAPLDTPRKPQRRRLKALLLRIFRHRGIYLKGHYIALMRPRILVYLALFLSRWLTWKINQRSIRAA